MNPSLTPEAYEILHAVAAADGTVMAVESKDPLQIVIGKRNLAEGANQRKEAAYKEAIDQLVEERLLRQLKPGGSVYEMTAAGYRLVDQRNEELNKKGRAPAAERLIIFLCHASEEKSQARDIYSRLRGDGFEPWLDKEKLLPGQEWDREIRLAVKSSHVVIVLLSRNSTTKEGYVQKEIKLALDAADEKPEGTIFIIPAKLEECDVPLRLQRWQWVNLFDADGYARLKSALVSRAEQIGHSSSEKVNLSPQAKDMPIIASEPMQCSLRFKEKQSLGGDATFYYFLGSCVPLSKVGTTSEREATWEFTIRLKVTRTLMACGTWPATPENGRVLQFFEYVKEELQKQAAIEKGKTVDLEVSSYTQEHRFERGPIYITERINPGEPFRLRVIKKAVDTANLLQISLRYEEVKGKITPERHDYFLFIELKNNGTEPVQDFYVELEFPRGLVENAESNEYLVRERSKSQSLFFRIPSARCGGALYPGDKRKVMRLPYFVNKHIYWERHNLLEREVIAIVKVPDSAPIIVRVPMSKLENF